MSRIIRITLTLQTIAIIGLLLLWKSSFDKAEQMQNVAEQAQSEALKQAQSAVEENRKCENRVIRALTAAERAQREAEKQKDLAVQWLQLYEKCRKGR